MPKGGGPNGYSGQAGGVPAPENRAHPRRQLQQGNPWYCQLLKGGRHLAVPEFCEQHLVGLGTVDGTGLISPVILMPAEGLRFATLDYVGS